MSELNTYVLASPEAADLVRRLGVTAGLAEISMFLKKHQGGIEAHRVAAEQRLRRWCGEKPSYTKADWSSLCAAAARLNELDHALLTAYYRWLGALIGLADTTAPHGGINVDGVTVDDIAPLHLSGALADLACDRRVFGLGKYGVPLAAGHPDCRNGLRQEIGDCANYALGAGLERTHPEVFAQLTAALTATLAALDEQS